MANRTKRQITIETHSITIIRTKGKSNFAFCDYCQKDVMAFSIEQTAEIWQMNLSEVCRQIESGMLHLVAGEGIALVCSDSFVPKNN